MKKQSLKRQSWQPRLYAVVVGVSKSARMTSRRRLRGRDETGFADAAEKALRAGKETSIMPGEKSKNLP